jgi:hypothetical protein
VNERDEVWSRRRIAVTKRGERVTAIDHEDARELPPVRSGDAKPANRCRAQPWPPYARMCKLAQRRFLEAEGTVKLFTGITDARHVRHAVVRKPTIGFLWCRHVHERHLRSCRFDGGAADSHARQRFAAERSTEVTEKNEQHGAVLLHLAQR